MERHIEVGTTDFIAAFKSSPDASLGRDSCCLLEKAQLLATFHRSDDIVVSATKLLGIPVQTSNPPTGTGTCCSPRQFLSSEVVKIGDVAMGPRT